MREMKFRAWDSEEKKFVLSNQIGRQNIPTRATRQGFALTTNFILMQFTGRKDKNGKEIYEGDIMKARYVTGQINICEIKFKDGCFGANGYCNWGDICEFKIIGNIYENPELLKEESKCKK